MNRKISTLITDFDNTLFDWFEPWHQSFSALVDEVCRITSLDREDLIPAIRSVHQKYGTSEYSFLLDELNILKPFLNGKKVEEVFSSAINAFRSKRRQYLRLYPKVLESLKDLKAKGIRIVIYTESQSFYSVKRLKMLGLEGVVDFIFSPIDQKGQEIDIQTKRRYGEDAYLLKGTKIFKLEEEEGKPNPKALLEILDYLQIRKDDALYIGDSLYKDVLMANKAGIKSVYAKYGIVKDFDKYKLLQNVSHWTDEDIIREQEIRSEQVFPTYTIEKGFFEVQEILMELEKSPQTLFCEY